MVRTLLVTAALLMALAGCDSSVKPPKTAPHAPAAAGERGTARANQRAERPDVTPAKIMRDVVGRRVPVSELTGIGPATEWTFDPDEHKQVNILERRAGDDGLTLVVFMTTRNNPRTGEDPVQVSGKLQLQYRWRRSQWALTEVKNLSFRYSIGLTI